MSDKVKWVRLGDYIEQSDERNKVGKYQLEDVTGISNEKSLISTKADMKDVELTPYKIFKPTEFCYVTVTSRNGNKISLALNATDQTKIVSNTYIVFRSKNANELLPEYLFMLFNRSEFDRYARFNSWGSTREVLSWSELCRVGIPLPPISVQRELVNTYNGLKALAEQNEALTKELSELKDQHLRLMAEYENFRKRSAKERADIYPEATARAIEAFLPLADNFERAAAVETADEKFKQGIMMIYSQLCEILKTLDV